MPKCRVRTTGAVVPNWTDVALGPSVGSGTPDEEAAIAATEALRQSVAELVNADNLIVLAGLGTSMGIVDAAGKRLLPSMTDLWDSVKRETGDDFGKARKAVNYDTPPVRENIEELLSRCQMTQSIGLTPSGVDLTKFVTDAERVIAERCSVEPTADQLQVHEEFLRRVVRRPPRRPRVNLFTTNYDRCFELAASNIGLPVIDGFTFSNPPRFQPEMFDYDIVGQPSHTQEPDYVSRLLRLFKLHGSVDWYRDTDGIVRKKTNSPVLIYPQYAKYEASYAPPFLEIMSRFQSTLRQRNVGVLVICCGLNDKHIAEPLMSAIRANHSLRLLIVAPDLCAEDAQVLYNERARKGAVESSAMLQRIGMLIDDGDARPNLLNGTLKDVNALIPSVFAKTDSERHDERILAIERKLGMRGAPPGV